MGRKDVVSRQYLSSDEVFADVVNLALYEGERIVQASDLVELDSTEEIAVTLEESLNKRTGNRKQTHAIQKYRDIVRQVMIDSTEEYLARIIVGIEEQSEVHYTMPARAAAVVNEFCTLDMSEQELEESRVINMCQAVRQMKEVSRREGEIAGEIKGEIKGQVKVYYQKLNYSAGQIAQELGMSVEAVEEIIRTL